MLIQVTVLFTSITTTVVSGEKPLDDILVEDPGRMTMKGPVAKEVTVVVEVAVLVVVLVTVVVSASVVV